jgi:hypothetical protein
VRAWALLTAARKYQGSGLSFQLSRVKAEAGYSWFRAEVAELADAPEDMAKPMVPP